MMAVRMLELSLNPATTFLCKAQLCQHLIFVIALQCRGEVQRYGTVIQPTHGLYSAFPVNLTSSADPTLAENASPNLKPQTPDHASSAPPSLRDGRPTPGARAALVLNIHALVSTCKAPSLDAGDRLIITGFYLFGDMPYTSCIPLSVLDPGF
ncbi:hypothetical protein BD779DRAFT_978383 [Infundibulicybe gibba]|nr:hypothetical protein BD779DRAFT_978383 [Infundibulicybe gibba]